MSSSPIDALLQHRPTDSAPPIAVTDGEQQGLLAALSAVPDPRDPRGVRYPLTSLLAVAVCAVLAGATTFAAIGDWAADLDEAARHRLGFVGRIPAGSTVWRFLVRIDAQVLQAVRITRTRSVVGAKTTRETVYLIVTLPAADAQPDQLGDWARREWQIENQLHWVRDVTFDEDAHQARTGNGPAVAAVLRNTAIGYHRSNGEPNIARATRRANRRSDELVDAVTSSYTTTQ
jgi:predicted transposase YbfD/YdcC